ncbi:hypothetical protein IGJ88_001243 [Enterococcus sp. DIV0733a]
MVLIKSMNYSGDLKLLKVLVYFDKVRIIV